MGERRALAVGSEQRRVLCKELAVILAGAAPTVEQEIIAHFGIGLAIVRRNVKLMDGTVLAENRAEGGVKVTVRLPIAPNL